MWLINNYVAGCLSNAFELPINWKPCTVNIQYLPLIFTYVSWLMCKLCNLFHLQKKNIGQYHRVKLWKHIYSTEWMFYWTKVNEIAPCTLQLVNVADRKYELKWRNQKCNCTEITHIKHVSPKIGFINQKKSKILYMYIFYKVHFRKLWKCFCC